MAYLERAKALKVELLNERTHQELWPGLHAILQWTCNYLCQWSELIGWSPAHVLAFSWMHATRVHNGLIAAGASGEAVVQEFTVEHQRLAGFVADVPAIRQDVTFPGMVRWRAILGRYAGEILQRTTQPIASALRFSQEELFGGLEGPERNVSWLHLMAESALRPNSLGSFLGGEWSMPLIAALGPETYPTAFLRSPEEEVVAALCLVEEKPDVNINWASLRAVLHEGPIHPTLSGRLEKLLQRTDFSFILAAPGNHANLLAPGTICSLANHLGSSELRERFKNQLLTCARRLCELRSREASVPVLNDELRDMGGALLEGCKLLTRNQDLSVTATEFFGLATQLIRQWPELGTFLREVLGASVPSPSPQNEGAWPFYLALRSSP